MVHEGRKDHKCNECGKQFPTQNYLKTHIQYVCEGRKDHKCNECGEQFSQESNMKTHIQTVQAEMITNVTNVENNFLGKVI